MTVAALGTKRRCLSCGAPFFDLQRDPIVCPKCGETFTPIALPVRPAFKARAPLPNVPPLPAAPGEAAVEHEDAEGEEESTETGGVAENDPNVLDPEIDSDPI